MIVDGGCPSQEFFQVESFSGEVFQVDTEDMKKKLRSSGESFQVFGRIYAPDFYMSKFSTLHMPHFFASKSRSFFNVF